jgi:membrane protein YdbS with pleckstrin-like domain
MDERVALHRAREAIARDDQETARRLLVQVLHEQPGSETAWMMLSTVIDQPDHKRDCLERVLRINPGNEAARVQLAALDASLATAPPPTTSPSPLAATAEAEQEGPEAALPEAEVEPAASEDVSTPSPSAETVPEEAIATAETATTAEALYPLPEEAGEVPSQPMAGVQDEPVSQPASTAPEDTAEQETATEATYSYLPSEPAAEALAEPPGEPVPELQGEPAAPEAVAAQSSFLQETLAPDEVVVHRTTLSPGVFLTPVAVVLGALILFLLPAGDLEPGLVRAIDGSILAIALVYLGLRAIRYFRSEYVVTSRRVLARRGLLGRLTADVPLSQIQEVTVGRGLFGRSPSSGNVWIRRTDRTQVMFWRIRRPSAFREAVDHARAMPEPGE